MKNFTIKEIEEILSLTIVQDRENKLLTFFGMLSMYTEDAQLNISFNAPSSSGKTFIPLQVALLFPQEDLMKLGNASPTSFFHEEGKYDKETNIITVDLSRRTIIFLDQPNNELLSRMRPILSHDSKIIQSKITDKNQKGGNRTKTVSIIGYPSVIFCSANTRIDEQEATRFLLLSPQTSQEKINYSIENTLSIATNPLEFIEKVQNNPLRKALMQRIIEIKDLGIQEIIIPEVNTIKERFSEIVGKYKPRNQRDIKHIISIMKAVALINPYEKMVNDKTIRITEEDIDIAFDLWGSIGQSQQYNLPPYILELYEEDIIKPYVLYRHQHKGKGLERKDILKSYFQRTSRPMDMYTFRSQVIPMLENAGLIYQQKDDIDRRRMLIYPTLNQKNYSEKSVG
jgi:hypothetical protein